VRSAAISSRMVEPDQVVTAEDVVRATREAGGEVRVLGGIAVAMRCPSARSPAPLARTYSDIDLATDRSSGVALARALEQMDFEPERRFNAIHGHSRLQFNRADGLHIDVFVNEFVMCHRLSLAERLAIHDTTIPLADLLLTKLQVAELNDKDVTDAAALLLDHKLTDDEAGINVGHVTRVLGRDWGWWRTVSENLDALPEHLGERLAEPAVAVVRDRLSQLTKAIADAPKSLRWRARAKAGERYPWRDDPEESH
jgi:hypothetical protein